MTEPRYSFTENDIKLWLADIKRSIIEINDFLPIKKDFLAFQRDLKTRKAVERNLEIIGEALNRILHVNSDILITNSRRIVNTRNEEFKKPKDSLQYILIADNLYKPKGSTCISIEPKSKAFTGKVYVLIDAKNSSTTFKMADLLQTTQSATLVGEKTGGTKQGLNGGQFFFLHFSYSHLEIDISLIWQAPTTSRTDGGVIPDHEVQTTPTDLLHNNDRPLNYTLSLIKK